MKDILSLGRPNTPTCEAIWRKLKERVNCQGNRSLEIAMARLAQNRESLEEEKDLDLGLRTWALPRSRVGKRRPV